MNSATGAEEPIFEIDIPTTVEDKKSDGNIDDKVNNSQIAKDCSFEKEISEAFEGNEDALQTHSKDKSISLYDLEFPERENLMLQSNSREEHSNSINEITIIPNSSVEKRETMRNDENSTTESKNGQVFVEGNKEISDGFDREEGELSPEQNSVEEQLVENTNFKTNDFHSIEQCYAGLRKFYAEAKRISLQLQEGFSCLINQRKLQENKNQLSAVTPEYALKLSSEGKHAVPNRRSRSRVKRSPSYRRRAQTHSSRQRNNRKSRGNSRFEEGKKEVNLCEVDRVRSNGGRGQSKRQHTNYGNKTDNSRNNCSVTRPRLLSFRTSEHSSEVFKHKTFSDRRERSERYKKETSLLSSPKRDRKINASDENKYRKTSEKGKLKPSKMENGKEKQRAKTLVTRQMKIISQHLDNQKAKNLSGSTKYSLVNVKNTILVSSNESGVNKQPSKKDKPSADGLETLEDLQGFLDVLKNRNRQRILEDETTCARLRKLRNQGKTRENSLQLIGEQSRISIRAPTSEVIPIEKSKSAYCRQQGIKNKEEYFYHAKAKFQAGSGDILVQRGKNNSAKAVKEQELKSPLLFDPKMNCFKKNEERGMREERPRVKFEVKSRNFKNSQTSSAFLNSDGYAKEPKPAEQTDIKNSSSHRRSSETLLEKDKVHKRNFEFPEEKNPLFKTSKMPKIQCVVQDDDMPERECEKLPTTVERVNRNNLKEDETLGGQRSKESDTTIKQCDEKEIYVREKTKQKRGKRCYISTGRKTARLGELELNTLDINKSQKIIKSRRKNLQEEAKTSKKIIIFRNKNIPKLLISPHLYKILASKQLKHSILLKALKQNKTKKRVKHVLEKNYNRKKSPVNDKSNCEAKERECSLEELEAFVESLRRKQELKSKSTPQCEFKINEGILRESRFLDRHRAKRKAKLMACASGMCKTTEKEAKLLQSMKQSTKNEDELEKQKVLKRLKAENEAVMCSNQKKPGAVTQNESELVMQKLNRKRAHRLAFQKPFDVSFSFKNPLRDCANFGEVKASTNTNLHSNKVQNLLNSLRARKKQKKSNNEK